jgi:hypothetical protein
MAIKMSIKLTAWICALLFALTTLWSVTVQGVFETARFDVPHFDAGAGDLFLLLRGGLAIIATLLLGVSMLFRQSWRSRLLIAVSGLFIVPVFLWSCLGLERWAAGYADPSFAALSQRYSAGQSLTAQQVLAALGQPVFTGSRPDGETVWSYSYMPSSGFGWHKRIVWLHGDTVTRVYSIDEP